MRRAVRPAKFSSNHCCHSERELAAILKKDDRDLGWNDFAAIFSISDCAAAYDEQLWFVPLAFDHLAARPRVPLGFVPFRASSGTAARPRLQTIRSVGRPLDVLYAAAVREEEVSGASPR